MQLIEGVSKLISQYYNNGLTLVLASSAAMIRIKNITKRFDLDCYFKDKLSGADLKASKPHTEIFINAAKAANTQPNECIVIEDSSNGILATKRVGIYCIANKSVNSKK